MPTFSPNQLSDWFDPLDHPCGTNTLDTTTASMQAGKSIATRLKRRAMLATASTYDQLWPSPEGYGCSPGYDDPPSYGSHDSNISRTSAYSAASVGMSTETSDASLFSTISDSLDEPSYRDDEVTLGPTKTLSFRGRLGSPAFSSCATKTKHKVKVVIPSWLQGDGGEKPQDARPTRVKETTKKITQKRPRSDVPSKVQKPAGSKKTPSAGFSRKTPSRRADTAAWIRAVNPVESPEDRPTATSSFSTISTAQDMVSSSFKSISPSSQEGNDSFISLDSDLLSVSEASDRSSSTKPFDESEPLFLVLSETLTKLLQWFKIAKNAAMNAAAGFPVPSTSASGGSNQHTTTPTTTPSTHKQPAKRTGGGGRKRGRASDEANNKEDDDDDDDDGDSNERSPKRQKTPRSSTGPRPRSLACPYWKRDPVRHGRCGSLVLSRIRDVKQHLHRKHMPTFYCERCFAVLPDGRTHQAHVLAANCARGGGPAAQLDGVSHQQRQLLGKKSNPALAEEEQWFTMWAILFPGTPRPFSAYIDPDLSADLCHFREHWQNLGPTLLVEALRSHRWAELPAEEMELQGRRILAEGLNRLYDGWLASRTATAMATPAVAAPVPETPPSVESGGPNRTPRTPLVSAQMGSFPSLAPRPPLLTPGMPKEQQAEPTAAPNLVAAAAAAAASNRQVAFPFSQMGTTGVALTYGVGVQAPPGLGQYHHHELGMQDEFSHVDWGDGSGGAGGHIFEPSWE